MLPAIYRELKETPQVASVTIRQASVDSFKNTVAKNMMHMRMINLIVCHHHRAGRGLQWSQDFAFGAEPRAGDAAGDRLHAARNLDDSAGRDRHDHAAGHSVRTGDGLLVCLDALLFFGPGSVSVSVRDRDSTYGLAAATVLAASIGSALLVRRKLDDLDLIAVLKSRE